MRIFYILNNRWPTTKAHGLQVAKTCEALQHVGATVQLVIPRRRLPAEASGVDPLKFYGIRERFEVVRLPSLDTTRKTLFALQQALFAFLAALYLVGKRGVVYTRDPFTAYVVSFMRKDVFWEAHRFPANTGSHFYRRLFRVMSGIVVITHGLERLFIESGVSPERITVVADAVDPGEFDISQTSQEARATLRLPVHGKIIGYVGQLTTLGEGKGIDDLIRAFALVRQEDSSATLLIVGGNASDVLPYQDMVKSMGLADATIFTGHQPHQNVPLYLRACDVLVMQYPQTPHYAHYMSPLKLFEYLATGKPIVTTDLPSVREVVGDEDVFFAQPGNAQSIADAIGQALIDPNRKTVRTLALAQKYSWQSRAEQVSAFINSRV